MKHISSKLIVMTILLVSILISVTAFYSLQSLRKESRAYTFQNQQLQTRILAKNFELNVLKAQEAAARVFALRTDRQALAGALQDTLQQTQRSVPSIQGMGIFLKDESSTGGWVESPVNAISSLLAAKLDFVRNLKETFVYSDPSQSGDHFILFPAKTAVIAVRISLDQIKGECQGLPVGIFNRTGEPILFCDAQIAERMKNSPAALKTAVESNFQSGSFEKSENNYSGLWAYAELSSWGKVVSVIDTVTAYRPAYLLSLRIVLLVLMSLGIAIIASILVARKVTDPISEVSRATQKIANGEFDTPILVKSRDETRVLADAVYSMAQKIKNLIQSEIEKTKLEAQLEIAGAVQRTLIPDTKIEIDQYLITSFYRPADECGGDWWGYVKGNKKLVILIGDVTGHGYPSALLVATTRGYTAMLQDHVDQVGEVDYSASEMLRILNRVVFEATRSELNMTAMIVVLDLETGKFTLASAGHNPAYQLLAASSEIKTLNGDGSRLGENKVLSTVLTEAEGTMELMGEKLILYTDGVQDLGSEEKPLGRKGFKKFLQAKLQENGETIVRALDEELMPLNEGRPLLDDITFLVLERKNESIS